MSLNVTHTFARLNVSQEAYDEIKAKLTVAGYQQAFIEGVIDMHGIGLVRTRKHLKVRKLEADIRKLRALLMDVVIAHVNKRAELPMELHGKITNALHLSRKLTPAMKLSANLPIPKVPKKFLKKFATSKVNLEHYGKTTIK